MNALRVTGAAYATSSREKRGAEICEREKVRSRCSVTQRALEKRERRER